MKRIHIALLTIAAALIVSPIPRAGAQIGLPLGTATVDPMLTSHFASNAGVKVASVISYKQAPTSSDLAFLQTLGIADAEGHVVLVVPDADVPLGGKLF